MKKIKELYRRYNEWEDSEVYIHIGVYRLTTNNFTLYVLPCIFALCFLMSKLLEY